MSLSKAHAHSSYTVSLRRSLNWKFHLHLDGDVLPTARDDLALGNLDLRVGGSDKIIDVLVLS